ncbi:uncharacterized protein THITE_111519 [Thermothielavioides terrestris NRRL 8126]|uniref:Uncharacterized protein n=1 Tax=Thermothielavioides terrestris (strain ATCC 38088 / NRRL 8126) TaxID=578455 RepID=G2QYN7_THETT|nr:uncharacterized protein THITE_111519 [Thermothielavioides terrestris NRRL 8126]AEO65425.1 hypothetical protein THITE_111519 [Thermothielavioides terrestris NRRL 8126]
MGPASPFQVAGLFARVLGLAHPVFDAGTRAVQASNRGQEASVVSVNNPCLDRVRAKRRGRKVLGLESIVIQYRKSLRILPRAYKTTMPLYFDIFLDELPIPLPTPLKEGNSAKELRYSPLVNYTLQMTIERSYDRIYYNYNGYSKAIKKIRPTLRILLNDP